MGNFFIIQVHVKVLGDEYGNVSIVTMNLCVYQALPVVFGEEHMLQVASEVSTKIGFKRANESLFSVNLITESLDNDFFGKRQK